MATSELSMENEIVRYVHMLNPRQMKTVLQLVKTFVQEKDDWWDQLSEEQVAAIKLAEQDLDAGKGIPHADVLKKYAKWL
jgi:hypothetical protein